MAGSEQHVIWDVERLGRAFWLPPGGWGNGLDDRSWVAMLDVLDAHAATLLLAALMEADVPGYAAVLPLDRRARVSKRGLGPPRVRIWVGAASYGRGRTTLMRSLPGLMERYGPQIVA